MGKKSSKNKDLQQPGEAQQPSRNESNERRDQQVNLDISTRHLSEIDRREGEMNHGETGGHSPTDNRA